MEFVFKAVTGGHEDNRDHFNKIKSPSVNRLTGFLFIYHDERYR